MDVGYVWCKATAGTLDRDAQIIDVQIEPAGPPLAIEIYDGGVWVVNGKRWNWWRRLLARLR